MTHLTTILAISWCAGITGLIGGLLAALSEPVRTERRRQFVHAIIAFGGGILIAAVSFSLAPESITELSATMLIVTFGSGGVLFCLLDTYLSRQGGSFAQFMAMIMDFVPEALALGALFVKNQTAAILLAVFIGAQNLPEGFNAFREFIDAGVRTRSALLVLFFCSALGPLAAGCGYYLLEDQPELTAGIMSFAGGGILFLVFQDIAPQSASQRHPAPTLGAVLGFLVGMLGKSLLG